MMPEQTEPASRLLDFESIYTGEAVDNGRMDVRDLAPSILATSILVEQISALINGPEKHVLTQYKTAKDGSFAAQLLLEAAWPQDETAIFDLPDSEVLKRILGVLWGGIAGAELAGLFQLIKFLKGHRIEKLETDGFPAGVVRVYNASGESIITSKAAMSMAMNPKARNEAYKVVKPLEKPGIDSFYVLLDKQPQGEPITKEDVAYFLPDLEESPPEEIEEIVQLVKADVSNPKAKWRFLSINSGRFSALISDAEFTQSFQNGTIRVGHNDSLRVKMLRRTIAWGSRVRLDYEVVKVIAYYPGGITNSQLSFPPNG